MEKCGIREILMEKYRQGQIAKIRISKDKYRNCKISDEAYRSDKISDAAYRCDKISDENYQSGQKSKANYCKEQIIEKGSIFRYVRLSCYGSGSV